MCHCLLCPALSVNAQLLLTRVVVGCAAVQPRARKFIQATEAAGNTLMVNASSSADAFDKLVGNKDFRPVYKLLQGRGRMIQALVDPPYNDVWNNRAREWAKCGDVLQQFIDRVWMQGCSNDDERWQGIQLAREFIWRFSQLAPVQR
jgi:hypothetical protein